MASAPLPQVIQKWGQRIPFYQAHGVSQDKLHNLMLQDISNVSQGKQPLTGAQVYDAAFSTTQGSLTGGPQQQGWTANPLHDIGLVGSDIAGTVRNFVGGTIHLAEHFPSEVTNTVDLAVHSGDPEWLQAHGFDPKGATDLGADLRNAASPNTLWSIFPGVGLAADLTTPEGRQHAETHPIGDILNVAPYIGTAGRLAAGGARTAEEVGAAAQEAGNVTRAGNVLRTPKQALQQRNPYAAAAIGASNVVRRVSGKDIRAGMVKILEDHNLDPVTREKAFRALFNANSATKQKLNSLMMSDEGLGRFIKNATDKERMELTQMANSLHYKDGTALFTDAEGKDQPVPVKWEAYIQGIKQYTDTIQRDSVDRGEAFFVPGPDGNNHFYKIDSPVGQKYQRVLQAAARVQEQGNKLRGVATTARDARDASSKRLADIQARAKDMQERQARGETITSEEKNKLLRDSMHTQTRRNSAVRAHDRAQQAYDKAQTELYSTMAQDAPMAFHPVIQHVLRERALQDVQAGKAANNVVAAQGMEAVLQRIKESPVMRDLRGMIGEKEYDQMAKESVSTWMKLSRDGYAPILIHNIVKGDEHDHLINPQVWKERGMTRDIFPTTRVGATSRPRMFDETPGVMDVAAGLTKAAADDLGREAMTTFYNDFLKPTFIQRQRDIRDDYIKASQSAKKDGSPLTQPELSAIDQEIRQDYTFINPKNYGVNEEAGTEDNALMIRSTVKNSLDKLSMTGKDKVESLPMFGAYSKPLNVWRFAVLTGPRHWVHVGVGGLMMATLREPFTITKLMRARQLVKKGAAPEELNLPLYLVGERNIFNYAAAKSVGRAYHEWWQKAQSLPISPRGMAHLEEKMVTYLRVATYLQAGAKGLNHDMAIREALRTYIDMGSMHPTERTVIRSIFPFYAFTKHILRYVLEYPVDHPVRAAMLANIANMEIEDWSNGLPQKFNSLLFLGTPDANGNVQGIDIKNVNPFRSLGNDFTLMGFMSGLTPAVTAVEAAAGTNVLSGTPELYPKLAIDPYSGSLVGTNPSGATQAAEQLIPEFGAIDHYLQLSDSMRALAKKNPGGFQRQLLSSLNIPFEWSQVNPSYEKQKEELNRYRIAQGYVSDAIKTGNWGPVKRFKLVPFKGKMVDPNVLEALYNQEVSRVNVPQGVSPVAVVKKNKRSVL